MKNETTGVEEFFVTPEVSEDTEDVVLMSDTEVLEAATVIAQVTASDEKFPFYLHYDVNQKEFLLSVLTAAGATIESDDVDNHILSVRMNMTQMKLVRYQDCVERVRTDEGMNTMLADEVIDEDLDAEINLATTEGDDGNHANVSNLDSTAEASSSARAMMLSEDEVMPAVAGEVAMTANNTEPRSTCCSPTNTTMETAKTIAVESLTSGHISCPGTAQWFMFTVPQTAEYTIYTTGALDTRGTLYDSNGQGIARVDDYEPCGKVNFRIIQELQANETYYVKVEVAKSGTGNYQLGVTQKTLVNKVNITPNLIVLDVGKTYELPRAPQTYAVVPGATCINNFGVTVSPYDADEQRILWSISGNSNGICSMTSGWHKDKPYTTLTTVKEGIVTLRAYDWFDHGIRGECTVFVGGAPVTGIKLNETTKEMCVGEEDFIKATVLPQNAFNTKVTWSSNRPQVAEVDEDGYVCAKKGGEATITARTLEGSFTAKCNVIVDSDNRQRVYISKDNDHVNILFENGPIWKTIDCDLSLDENRTRFNLWLPESYTSLNLNERRYVDNLSQSFTADELAFIYRFDPLGIEYYMREEVKKMFEDTADSLYFKDDVYIAIFGEPPQGRFYFTIDDNNQAVYKPYLGINRTEKFSNAEILFGTHVDVNWSYVMKSICSFLFNMVPGSSIIQSGISVLQELFHSGSFVGIYGSMANDFSKAYASNEIKDEVKDYLIAKMTDVYGESYAEKHFKELSDGAGKRLKWVNKTLDVLKLVKDLALNAFIIPNTNMMTIYQKIEDQTKYKVIFDDVSLKSIINQCSNN